MFIGQIGFTYVYGLQSVWLMFGLIFGDFISSLFVHKSLRKKSEELKVFIFANLVSKWHGKNYKYVQLFGGFIIIILFCYLYLKRLSYFLFYTHHPLKLYEMNF